MTKITKPESKPIKSGNSGQGKKKKFKQEVNVLVRQRSPLRCHLVGFTPLFDSKGVADLYYLRFSKGNILQLGALSDAHVYHIIMGFFVRRDINNFVGAGAMAMIKLPICEELLKESESYQCSRLCVKLHDEEHANMQTLHLIKTLHRRNMHFAITLDRYVSTAFSTISHCFDYIVIDTAANFKEQLMLFFQIKEQAKWLKVLAINVQSQEEADTYYSMGVDLCDYSYYEVADHPSSITDLTTIKDMFSLMDLLLDKDCDFNALAALMGHNDFIVANYINTIAILHPKEVSKISSMQASLEIFDRYEVRKMIAIALAYSVLVKQLSFNNYEHVAQDRLDLFGYGLMRAKFIELLMKKSHPEEMEISFVVALFSVINDYLRNRQDLCAMGIAHKIYSFLEQYEGRYLGDYLHFAKTFEVRTLADTIFYAQKYDFKVLAVFDAFEMALIWSNKIIDAVR